MAIESFNVTPYYDDYDETKKFYRILFRPGFAVQSRELTQMQTILQKQIERFGRHVFKDGSYVKGGEGVLNIDAVYVKVDTLTPENGALLVGKTIIGQTSGAIGDVIAHEEATIDDPVTLIIVPKNGKTFTATEQVVEAETGIVFDVLDDVEPTGPASTYSIGEGIVFANGFFCFVEQKTLVLDKYSNKPSYVVGLQFTDDIVTTIDDESLLDPANGAFNFNAPGGDRYRITFDMVKKPLPSDPAQVIDFASEGFVQISSVKEGKIYEEIKYPIYSELEKTLARRTYDESGDYTVRPFKIQITDDINGDPSKLTVGLSPGKAYVRGFEFETSSTQYLTVDRAQDTESVRRFDTAVPFQSYVIISNIVDGFALNTFEKLSLRNSSNVEIGFANIRYLEYITTGVYKLYLFNIQMSAGTLENITRIVGLSSGGSADIHISGRVLIDGVYYTRLFGNDKRLGFTQLPHSFIAGIDPVGDKYDIAYRYQNVFYQVFNGGQVTITAPAGTQFILHNSNDLLARLNFVVFDTTNDIVREVFASYISYNPQATTATIDFGNATLSFNSVIYAIVEVDPVTIGKKQLKETTRQINLTGVTAANKLQFSLNVPDGYDLLGIWQAPSYSIIANETHSNVTDDYIFDNGQRDEFYDHARILLKPTANVAQGNLLVKFRHFEYENNYIGPFTVDSYVGSGVTYAQIPKYTATDGTVYRLRDVIDFRPVRDPSAETLRGVTVSPFYEVEASFRYYIPRIDKVVATKDREFQIVKGISSISPQAPADIDNSMNLYVLTMPPFTENPGDVQIKFIENKRYTMRDIGRLETRIKNLEYYTSLAFLEKQAKDQTIRDNTNTVDRFKNGFIVDAFAGHSVGDVGNFEYKCSMDFVAQFLRCPFESRNYNFNIEGFNLFNTTRRGQFIQITPNGTEGVIQQGLASKAISINPFNVTNWYGSMKLVPSSDTWFDTEQRPDVLVNLAGENDAWQYIAEAASGTKWNAWQDNWSTRTVLDEKVIGERDIGAGGRHPQIGIPSRIIRQDLLRTVSSTSSQTRTGIETNVGFESVQESLGDRVVDLSVIPYIRSRGIRFTAKGMKPDSRVYAYFDGKLVDEHIIKAPQLFFNQSTVTPANGKFIVEDTNEELVVGQTSGATALAVSQSVGKLTIVSKNGNFQVGETVVGQRSGVSFLVSNTTQPVLGSSVGGPTQFVTDSSGEFSGVFIIPNTDSLRFRTGERQFRLTDSPVNEVKSASTTAEANYLAQGFTKTVENTIVSTMQPKLSRRSVTEDRIVSNVFIEAGAGVSRDVTRYYDPLAQTFLIDGSIYPNGVYIDSVDTFFKRKDATLPVTLQIRTTVNGYPSSSTILPFAEKTLDPADVNTTFPVPVGLTEEKIPSLQDSSTQTKFSFDTPVYLAPGEYSIVLLSNSNLYEAYVAEMGGTQLGTNKLISEQPYTGSLFKSQNAATWTPIQEEDLMFRINALTYPTTGSFIATLVNGYYDPEFPGLDEFKWHTGHVNMSNIVGKSDSIKLQWRAKNALDSFVNDWTVIEPLENFAVESEKIISLESGDAELRVELNSTDKYTSPSIDVSRLALTAVSNIINSDTTNETLPSGGSAAARYITRRVELNDGFDATDLKVYADLDFGRGDVKVYYKIINEADSDTFEQKPWVEMDRKLNGKLSNQSVFVEYEFSIPAANKDPLLDEVVYGTSPQYTGFRTFAIKIVMLSAQAGDGTDKLSIPRVRNLRCIALA